MTSPRTIFIIGLIAFVGVCTTGFGQLPITSTKREMPTITAWGLLGFGSTSGIASNRGEADHAPQTSMGVAVEVALSTKASLIVEFSKVDIEVTRHGTSGYEFIPYPPYIRKWTQGGWYDRTEGYIYGAYGRIGLSDTGSLIGVIDFGLDFRSVDPMIVSLNTICPRAALGARIAPRSAPIRLCASVGFQQGCFGFSGSFGIAF